MNDIILVDKPFGYSSFQVVAFIKGLLGIKKIGHGGTLDPLAVGMLPICLGESRKFSSYLLDADKHYTVTANLGLITTTGDLEGEVLKHNSSSHVNTEELEIAMNKLLGEITQIPPMYSALKHMGKPLYEYARAGKTVERKSRQVTIHKFRLLDWQPPLLKCEVQCSKGTYIRTLLDMLGSNLGVEGASLTYLRRDWVAPFVNEQVITIEELAYYYEKNAFTHQPGFVAIDQLFYSKSRYDLEEHDARSLAYGQKVIVTDTKNLSSKIALFVNNVFFGLASLEISGTINVIKLRQSMVQDLCSLS